MLKAQGLTVVDIAAAAGLGRSTVGEITRPDKATVQYRVANAIGGLIG